MAALHGVGGMKHCWLRRSCSDQAESVSGQQFVKMWDRSVCMLILISMQELYSAAKGEEWHGRRIVALSVSG